jgi:hypothetical protein
MNLEIHEQENERLHRQRRYIRGCEPKTLESTGYEQIKMRDQRHQNEGYRGSVKVDNR